MGIIVHCREEKRLVLELNKKPQYIEVTCDCCGETIPLGELYYSVSYADSEVPYHRTDEICCRDCTDIISKKFDSFKHLEIERHRYDRVFEPYMDDVTYICDDNVNEQDVNVDAFIKFVSEIASDKYQIDIVNLIDGEEEDG